MKKSTRLCCKSIGIFLAAHALFSALPANALGIALDFSKVSQQQAELIDSDWILSLINENADYINEVTNIEGVEFNKFTISDLQGLKIASTPDKNGTLTFVMNPKINVKADKLRITVLECEDYLGSDKRTSAIEISVNGKSESFTFDCETQKKNITLDYIFPTPEPIEYFTLTVPYMETLTEYYVILKRINIVYTDETKDPLEFWNYSVSTHIGYLDEEEYVMPDLLSQPAYAAQMAEISSSNPEVADVDENGKMKLLKKGTTTISAKLGDNKIFHDGGLPHASYNLIVDETQGAQTSVVSIYEQESSGKYFDLHGREVKGTPSPGIYIYKTGAATRKVLIRP